MQENTFEVRWCFDKARQICGRTNHASATGLNRNFAPPNLGSASSPTNPDKETWLAAHNEEHDGLDNSNVFTETSTEECNQCLKRHGDDAKAIPTMNLFTIRSDEKGNPIRAKSQIAALGNLEQCVWSRED